MNIETPSLADKNFSERLLQLIHESGYRNAHSFSIKLGYKHSEKINRLLRNSINKPSYDILLQIAKAFPRCNLNWLIAGRGDIWKDSKLAKNEHNDDIPLYDIVATAGNAIAFWENEENIMDYIPRKLGMRDCHLAIHVHGESMYPIYMPGDVVLLREIFDYQFVNYGQVYVVITEEHRLLKYVYKGKNEEHLILRSENQHFEEIEVHKNKIIKLLQVQGFFRKIGL